MRIHEPIVLFESNKPINTFKTLAPHLTSFKSYENTSEYIRIHQNTSDNCTLSVSFHYYHFITPGHFKPILILSFHLRDSHIQSIGMPDIAVFNQELSRCLERDGATLVTIQQSIVLFICKCGAHYKKQIRAICTTTGAFCKYCSQRNTAIKRIQIRINTNLSLINS